MKLRGGQRQCSIALHAEINGTDSIRDCQFRYLPCPLVPSCRGNRAYRLTIRSEEYVKAAIIAHTTRLDRYFRDILKIQIFESNYRTGSQIADICFRFTFTFRHDIRAVLREAVEHAGIADAGTALAGQVTVRRGTNARGEQVTYLLNYSADEVTIASPVSGDVVVAPVVVGTDGTVDESATAAIALKEGSKVEVGDRLTIGRWPRR